MPYFQFLTILNDNNNNSNVVRFGSKTMVVPSFGNGEVKNSIKC